MRECANSLSDCGQSELRPRVALQSTTLSYLAEFPDTVTVRGSAADIPGVGCYSRNSNHDDLFYFLRSAISALTNSCDLYILKDAWGASQRTNECREYTTYDY
jgi:hypothetical protein